MKNVIRVALPDPNNPGQTYDAFTDTNLDHFALYTDEDNVLIKEKTRGSFDIVGDGTGTTQTIPHNLGYVPFFLVFVLDTQATAPAWAATNNKWKLLAHNTAGASVPDYIAVADSTNLYITNFTAATISFKYFIFYDNVVGSSGISITESEDVFKIAKQGFDAKTEKDPNNLIFHGDLNTFKILKEGTGTINYTADGVYTFAHGASISNPSAYMVFIKFPDGYTSYLPGKGVIFSRDSAMNIHDSYIDTTNIGMYIDGDGSPHSLPYKYYIFETPLA